MALFGVVADRFAAVEVLLPSVADSCSFEVVVDSFFSVVKCSFTGGRLLEVGRRRLKLLGCLQASSLASSSAVFLLILQFLSSSRIDVNSSISREIMSSSMFDVGYL